MGKSCFYDSSPVCAIVLLHLYIHFWLMSFIRQSNIRFKGLSDWLSLIFRSAEVEPVWAPGGHSVDCRGCNK